MLTAQVTMNHTALPAHIISPIEIIFLNIYMISIRQKKKIRTYINKYAGLLPVCIRNPFHNMYSCIRTIIYVEQVSAYSACNIKISTTMIRNFIVCIGMWVVLRIYIWVLRCHVLNSRATNCLPLCTSVFFQLSRVCKTEHVHASVDDIIDICSFAKGLWLHNSKRWWRQ